MPKKKFAKPEFKNTLLLDNANKRKNGVGTVAVQGGVGPTGLFSEKPLTHQLGIGKSSDATMVAPLEEQKTNFMQLAAQSNGATMIA